MNKRIPKIGINKYIYKKFTLFDVVVFSIMLIISAFLVALKNRVCTIFAGVIVLLSFFFQLELNEERIYLHIFYFFKYQLGKKNYKNHDTKDLFEILNIEENGLINIKDGGVARIGIIKGKKFFSITENQIESVTLQYKKLFNILKASSRYQIIKIDENIDYSEMIAYRNSRVRKNQLEINKQINEEEITLLDEFSNSSDMKLPKYLLVYFAKNKMQINETTEQIKNTLNYEGNAFVPVVSKNEILKYISNMNDIEQINSFNEISKCKIYFKDSYYRYSKSNKYIIQLNKVFGDVNFGFFSKILNINDVSVSMNIEVLDKESSIKNIDRTIMDFQDALNNTDISSKQILLSDDIEALRTILDEIKDDTDSLIGVAINIFCKDKKTKNSTLKELRKMGFTGRIYKNRIKDAFKSYQMCGKNKTKKFSIMSGSTLAFAYPFFGYSTQDVNGHILGLGSLGELAIVDFDKREKSFTNSNIVIIGKAGSGKSYFTKHLISSFLSDNQKVYILDPENEYEKLALSMGGEVVDVNSDSFRINPLDPLVRVSGNSFFEHLSFLDAFYHNIFSLEDDEIEILNHLTIRLYKKMGINEDTIMYVNDYPTFEDLYKYILNEIKIYKDEFMVEALKHISIQLLKCVEGRYSKLWNVKTKFNVTSDIVVFKFQSIFQTMNINLIIAQMILVSKFLNAKLIENYKAINCGQGSKLNIIVDEAHRFIDEKNRIALNTMYIFAKQCRKYGCKLITITQSVADFLSSKEVLKESKAIISESQYTFILGMSPQHINDLKELFSSVQLTHEELELINNLEIGSCLLVSSNASREFIKIKTNSVVSNILK